MRDKLLIRIDEETSTLENPIKSESLTAGTIQGTGSIYGAGKILSDSTEIKVFDSALTAEEVKEVISSSENAKPTKEPTLDENTDYATHDTDSAIHTIDADGLR